MRFSREHVAFGRHETFHIRYSWLPKGVFHYRRHPDYFGANSDMATVELGVGKNMVSSIKYWLRSTQLIDGDSGEITDLAELIFGENYDGYDPYLEDQATLWLIHWSVASNTSLATTIAWFFSHFHKREFNQEELRGALSRYIDSDIKDGKRPSAGTIKNDISVLTRMYAKSQHAPKNVNEEALDSPLSELDLITGAGHQQYISKFTDQVDLPCEILGYAIVELMNSDNKAIAPIKDLIHASDNAVSIASIFRITEESFIVKLEELAREYSRYFELRETAGIRQIYLTQKIDPLQLLREYYGH